MSIDPRLSIGAMGEAGAEAVPYEPVTLTDATQDPETDADAAAQGELKRWTFWSDQVRAALTNERRWRGEATEAEDLYFGPDNDPGAGERGASKENRINDVVSTIHGNIEVLKPLVFSNTPQPIVQRRWRGDGKADETDTMAAEAGQRLASYLVSTSDFEGCMERVRDDWLIAGRGFARGLYKAKFRPAPVLDPLGQPVPGPDGRPLMRQEKVDESVHAAAVEWPRFLVAPGSSWERMPWIAFEVPMFRSEVGKRFPDKAERFAYNVKGLRGREIAFGGDDKSADLVGSESSATPSQSPFDTAVVWEIWDRLEGKVLWWSPDARGCILDEEEDPLGLEKFFPGPKPLLATTKGDELTPRPDVMFYKRFAEEIDQATRKMDSILDVISVSGLLPGAMADQVKELLSGRNRMIPVESWIGLLDKGGMAGIIQWLPLEPMMKALQALDLVRQGNQQRLFEASGVSDIMRAQGDPNETATAQQIKGRYAGLRLGVKQRRMALFARDMLRILVELACEFFDTGTLAEICGLDIPLTEAERQQIHARHQALMAQHQAMMQERQSLEAMVAEAQAQGRPVPPLPPAPSPPPDVTLPGTSWELVHARLRDDLSRKITIQIETDSTILTDEAEDRQARVEFLSAFAAFVQQILPMVGAGFKMQTVKELLLFGVRGFRNARTLEAQIADLPDEVPQGEQAPDVALQVAELKAGVERELKAMDLEDAELNRQHELKIKGLDALVEQAAAESGAPKDPPQEGA